MVTALTLVIAWLKLVEVIVAVIAAYNDAGHGNDDNL